MEKHHQDMYEQLKNEWVSYATIDALFGIKMPDELLLRGFQAWAKRLRQPREVFRPDEAVNRFAFESFLQHTAVLPLKTASARLGMERESLVTVLQALEDTDLLILNTLHFSEQVIPESIIRRMHEYFPALRTRVFTSHSAYCRRLHEAIATELGMTVQSVYCVTSQFLKEDPVDYAYDYDCITGNPVGLRYQVWLNFNKPINLRPDICSLLFYAANEEMLATCIFAGKIPEVPALLKGVR